MMKIREFLDDEQKDKAYEKISGLLERVKNEEDFYTLAEANTEAGEIELTFGKTEGLKSMARNLGGSIFIKNRRSRDIIVQITDGILFTVYLILMKMQLR